MEIDCPILSTCFFCANETSSDKREVQHLDGNAPKPVTDVSSQCVAPDWSVLEEAGVWVGGMVPRVSKQRLMDELLSEVWHFCLYMWKWGTCICMRGSGIDGKPHLITVLSEGQGKQHETGALVYFRCHLKLGIWRLPGETESIWLRKCFLGDKKRKLPTAKVKQHHFFFWDWIKWEEVQ